MATKVGKPKSKFIPLRTTHEPGGSIKVGYDVVPKETPRNAVALPGKPWSQLALELERYTGAPFVKFTKDGQFAISETDVIPEGTKCIAKMNLVQTGWLKWLDGQKDKAVMGAVADGFVPPKRDALGDTDEGRWDRDASGKPRDPWQFTMALPIQRLDTDEGFIFTTGSKGGLGAVNGLIRTYGGRVARGKTNLPIVELQAGSYKHREYGKIYFPKFTIVNWTDDENEGGGKPMSVERDLDDQIPL